MRGDETPAFGTSYKVYNGNTVSWTEILTRQRLSLHRRYPSLQRVHADILEYRQNLLRRVGQSPATRFNNLTYSPAKQRGRRKDVLNAHRVLCDQGCNCTGFVAPICHECLEICLEKQICIGFPGAAIPDPHYPLHSDPVTVSTSRHELLHDSNQV